MRGFALVAIRSTHVNKNALRGSTDTAHINAFIGFNLEPFQKVSENKVKKMVLREPTHHRDLTIVKEFKFPIKYG